MFPIFTKYLTRQVFRNAGKLQYFTEQKFSKHAAVPLRPKKPKSERKELQYFSDAKQVRVSGGAGGDGCISFLQLWSNDKAGPDGGDGGNGGHVIFEASHEVRNLNHIMTILKGEDGEKGNTKDCHGKNAKHTVVKVPVGTIIRNSIGKVVGDLHKENLMFVAARGGSGGKGNHFFATDTQQAPKICEYGAKGEETSYFIEIRSMANIGLIGLPNAGKSTLLQAITRARPKVAPYPFTTLRPHLGIVQYDDHEQVAVADLPGLIEGSHKNRGLGIQFLKHAERCRTLLFVLDASQDEPLTHYKMLLYELEQFSSQLVKREKLIVANKIDLPGAEENVKMLTEKLDIPVIGVSAKMGTNLTKLLEDMRKIYDRQKSQDEKSS